ncbi:HprK-related kinase A [Marinobacterium aestuariivivens]|uniref:HprK-related kinase A n=1 Tax=Marinobacterium aestuariivivens TaxID=1698799 RepID=A0ABW1ZUX4_9GAMM
MTDAGSDDTWYFDIGALTVALSSPVGNIKKWIPFLYRSFRVTSSRPVFVDFRIRVEQPASLRRWFRPQANFYLDGYAPFKPLPVQQAVPLFEWGLNWCIANQYHRYLHFHAAGVEKNGVMVILPAPPGSGKSTLAAALMQHGWRLFSDEIVMVEPSTTRAAPIGRPVNLKNESIDLLQGLFPRAELTEKFYDTSKGVVALMKPTDETAARASADAMPTHIVTPRYLPNSPLRVRACRKPDAFMALIGNSFNYHILGKVGFDAACRLVDRCDCFTLEYSRFDEVFEFFDGLCDGSRPG